MANSVDPDQIAPIGAVCSGSKLFASILNSSVMLGNYLQLTTSADDIFRCIFCATLRVKTFSFHLLKETRPNSALDLRRGCISVCEQSICKVQIYRNEIRLQQITQCYLK